MIAAGLRRRHADEESAGPAQARRTESRVVASRSAPIKEDADRLGLRDR